MCQADELSLRREANGKVTGEFIPRCIKRERKRQCVLCLNLATDPDLAMVSVQRSHVLYRHCSYVVDIVMQ